MNDEFSETLCTKQNHEAEVRKKYTKEPRM